MLWIALGVYVVSFLAAAMVQQRFFNLLARQRQDVISDANYADRVLSDPRSLIPLTASQTGSRLRALLRRNADPAVERWRLAACVAIAISIAAFVWLIASMQALSDAQG
jgi:hypothetical protein